MKTRVSLITTGLFLTTLFNGRAITHYVDLNNPNPTPPYTNWVTAAAIIQAAVDAAAPGDEIVVTNGVYATGGRAVYGTMTNRVAVTKPLFLHSVNGPQFTVIQGQKVPGTTNGDGAVRCVYLTNGASLSGFTLANGATRGASGIGDYYRERTAGGLWCESTNSVITNCVLAANSAFGYGGGVVQGTLINCELTGNSADEGGGAAGGTLINCTLNGNSAGQGGGVVRATLNHCALTGNSAGSGGGGGAYDANLNNCTLTGNFVWVGNLSEGPYGGGGAAASTLNSCTLTANSTYVGGGAYGCTLNNCFLAGNSALLYGGGAADCTLNTCTLTLNSVSGSADSVNSGGLNSGSGGGAFAGVLNNCTLTGNSAQRGGGASGQLVGNVLVGPYINPCTLNNCTLTGNSSSDSGGGVYFGNLNNCIVYFNTAPIGLNYDPKSTFNYSCTTPLPTFGTGNTPADPQLASASHLSFASPCRGAGSTNYASGTDIDGEVWASPPSMGCDEYHVSVLTVPLSVGISATFTNVAVGYPLELTALIEGRPIMSVWDFGDGDFELDQPFTQHAWVATGDYPVDLWAFNETSPDGVKGTVVVHVVERPVHYVAVSNTNPVSPYASWGTAATNIQDAVDAATVPGALVLVSNGVYAIGGRMAAGTTNRLSVVKPLAVESVNGSQFTRLDGTGAARCAYLTNGATLSGFTLTNGFAQNGGGVFCGSETVIVSDCVLSGNQTLPGGNGGGAYGGTLNHCLLTGNSATWIDPGGAGWGCLSCSEGGAAYFATLSNCMITSNSATYGGGSSFSTLNNCQFTGNWATNGGGGAHTSTLDNCILNGNWAYHGGGVYSGTLNACTLTGNSARGGDFSAEGGGAHDCTLNNCTLTGNSADYAGGGASQATLTNCTLTGNSAYSQGGGAAESTLSFCMLGGNVADFGGGADNSTLSDCTLTNNSAGLVGGGADGGTMNHCALTGNSARVGGGGVYAATLNRCTLTGNSANVGGGAAGGILNNCFLTGNSADSGGGASGIGPRGIPFPWIEGYVQVAMNNCALTGNSATNGGGGVSGGTLTNCTLSGNSAGDGGGAYGDFYEPCTLNNCTMSANSAGSGGGAAGATLLNSLVYFNVATNGANYDSTAGSTLNYCCTTPMPTNGMGNITNAPLFLDYAGGNLRLQSNSPCINAGNNAYAPPGPDLGANPRIVGGTVDIGAYEFQAPASIISYAWLQQFSLPTDGSADFGDPDGDGLNNWQEWRVGTDPTNVLSVLKMLTPSRGVSGISVSWQSVAGVTYALERSTNLLAQPAFSVLQSNIVGRAGTTSYNDTGAVGTGALFYRVGVRP